MPEESAIRAQDYGMVSVFASPPKEMHFLQLNRRNRRARHNSGRQRKRSAKGETVLTLPDLEQ